MVKFLLKRPISVIAIYMAFFALGIWASYKIPISSLPDVNIPFITIHVNQTEMSAQEIDRSIVSPLSVKLLGLTGIDDVNSETSDGYSLIKLQFEYGTDLQHAFMEVSEKIDLSMNSFPRDFQRPKVVKASVTDFPVFHLNVSLADSSLYSERKILELSEYAEQVIKRRLEQYSEITFVDVTGLTYPEILISPREDAVKSLGITDKDFAEIISANNMTLGNIIINDGELQYSVKILNSKVESLNDLGEIYFKHEDKILQLKDISSFSLKEGQANGMFLSENLPAVDLAIIKHPNAKVGDLKKVTNSLIDDLRKENKNLKFKIVKDQTEFLESSISSLKQDLFWGCFLAFILMFFFLKNVRSPLLIGISIPVSLSICILFFYMIGLSINIISLSGLVLGVGLMVDNSIIVIDNMSQYRSNNYSLLESCHKGASDVIRPLISSALTTCSVFVPLIFISGIAGALFYDQAIAITIGLTISLVVSITLLPTLFHLFHNKDNSELTPAVRESHRSTFLIKFYENGLNWVFKHKLLSLIAVLMLLCSNFYLFTSLKRERLPSINHAATIAHIDWNQNIGINESKRRALEVCKQVEHLVMHSDVLIGEQQYLLSRDEEMTFFESKFYFQTSTYRLTSMINGKIADFLKSKYPAAQLKIDQPKDIFEKVFGSDSPPLLCQFRNVNNEQLPGKDQINGVIKELKFEIPGIRIDDLPMQRNVVILLDIEKMILYDLTTDLVLEKLRSILGGTELYQLRQGQKLIPVVTGPQHNNILRDGFMNKTIRNRKGGEIPLSQFVDLSNEEVYKEIHSNIRGSFIPVAICSENPAMDLN